MTVSFHPMIYDAQSASWRAVDVDSKDRDAFELNLSNAYATDLLAALGLASYENAEPHPIEALSHLVTAALRRRLGKRSPAQPAFVEQQPGKVAVIRCARHEGYLEERLGDLARLIQRGRAVDATHIGWS